VAKPSSDEIKQLVADMAETMYSANGAGLAAIQVGVPLRLFIVDAAIVGKDESEPPLVFINPEIIELGEATETSDEGCLSFPGIYVPIKRSLKAKVRAVDLEGKTFEMEGEGLMARAFQHENDHLDAKLLAHLKRVGAKLPKEK